MKQLRIAILYLILFLSITLYISVNKADEFAGEYKDDRFLSLKIYKKVNFLAIDSPEVLYIESQARHVWKNIFTSYFLKGVFFILLCCFIAGIYLYRKKAMMLQIDTQES